MSTPDIRDRKSFEQHVNFTANNLNPDLTVDEIVDGVNRLTQAPEAFGETEIGGVRRIGAISTLIRSSTQTS